MEDHTQEMGDSTQGFSAPSEIPMPLSLPSEAEGEVNIPPRSDWGDKLLPNLSTRRRYLPDWLKRLFYVWVGVVIILTFLLPFVSIKGSINHLPVTKIVSPTVGVSPFPTSSVPVGLSPTTTSYPASTPTPVTRPTPVNTSAPVIQPTSVNTPTPVVQPTPTNTPSPIPATPSPQVSPTPTASPLVCVDSQNKSREETGTGPNPVTYPPVTVAEGCVLVVNSYQGCVNSQCWNDGAVIAFRSGTYNITLLQGAYDISAVNGGKQIFCYDISYITSNNYPLHVIQPLPQWGSC